MASIKEVRSIFISDVHLGCRFCKAKQLSSFLKEYKPQFLYLVGDIVDGWKMQKQHFYWDDTYSFVLRRVLSMVKTHNTKVFYITGNHDEFLRNFSNVSVGNIELKDEIVHETPDGKRMLVIHGDKFDHLTKHMTWLYFMGDSAYTMALRMNGWLNFLRRKLGLKYWSFSNMLKQKVKKAVNFINKFEKFTVKYTLAKKCDGVICGHIHVPDIKNLDGIEYYNCGDWMENCTALIENYNGGIELVQYTEFGDDQYAVTNYTPRAEQIQYRGG